MPIDLPNKCESARINSCFQSKETVRLIDGPVGSVQVKTQASSDDGVNGVGILCHPHPLFGGSMDNKVVHTLFRSLRAQRLHGVRFNFRGVGLSEGQYADGVGEQQDLAAVERWVYESLGEVPWVLAGFSFGAYVAAAYLQGKSTPWLPCCQRLLLVAPPVHHFDFEVMGAFPCPVDVIQGTQDEVVPVQDVIDWVGRRKGAGDDISLHLVDGVSHFFHGALPRLKETVITIIEKTKLG